MAFSIEIVVGKDAASSSVKATGEEWHVITDKEAQTFGITDAALKSAVEAYFGKKPNDAYLHSPTPWNDLYKTYNWEQVTVHLRTLEASIIDISSKPVILKTQTFKNKSSKTATFDVSIYSDVSDTVEANWSQTVGLSFTQSISYGTKIFGGETSITFSAEFQQGGSKSQTVTVGQSSGVMVDLDPGESVKAILSAHHGSLGVRVAYEAYLSGLSAVNYNPTYKDHHFWALAIDGVRQAVKLPGTFRIVDDIRVGYFSDGEIVLEDLEGKRIAALGARLLRYAAGATP
jgi:hypothetical protein